MLLVAEPQPAIFSPAHLFGRAQQYSATVGARNLDGNLLLSPYIGAMNTAWPACHYLPLSFRDI